MIKFLSIYQNLIKIEPPLASNINIIMTFELTKTLNKKSHERVIIHINRINTHISFII